MAFPLIVSFYTKNSQYVEVAQQRLIQTCKEQGLEYDVRGIDGTGNWVRNCAKKGGFVLEMLRLHKRPVLWVDCDAEIVAPLPFFENLDERCDLSAHVIWLRNHRPPTMAKPSTRMLSGTVYINHTPAGLRVAKMWADLCEKAPNRWDQKHLAQTWWNLKDEIRFVLMPQAYCKIYDRIWREGRDKSKWVPRIVHYQASRKLRKGRKRRRPSKLTVRRKRTKR